MLKNKETKQKRKWVLKDLNGKIVEKFRYIQTIHNSLSRLEELHGKLKIEPIENA